VPHRRDHRSGALETATVSAEEFITRFLAHVLPERFTKVRYSGLFSSSNRHRLEIARTLLAPPQAPPAEPPEFAVVAPPGSDIGETSPQDSARCPQCKVGRLVLVEVIPRPRRPSVSTRAPPGPRAGSPY
jgi:hypothetical protein